MRKEYDFSAARRGSAVASRHKTRITIMLDESVLAHFRKEGERQGVGYQTLINQALLEAVSIARKQPKTAQALTADEFRRILREELQTV